VISPLDVVIPAVVAAIVLALCRKWPWGGPLAVVAGFVATYPGINGRIPPLPPSSATDWLFYAALATALMAATAVWMHANFWTWAILVPIGTGLTVAAVLSHRLENAQGLLEPLVWIGLLGAAGMFWCFIFQRGGDTRVDRLLGPAAMVLLGFFCTGILVLSRSIIYGRISLALTAAMLPAAIATIWRKDLSFTGPAMVFVATMCGLLAAGHFFAALSGLNLCLILVSPLVMAAAGAVARKRKCGPAWVATVSLAAMALPLLLAAVPMIPDFVRSISPASDPYGP
jgi:hypothetical protein